MLWIVDECGMKDLLGFGVFAINAGERHGLVGFVSMEDYCLADKRAPNEVVFKISKGRSFVEVEVDLLQLSAPTEVAFYALLNEYKAAINLFNVEVTITLRYKRTG